MSIQINPHKSVHLIMRQLLLLILISISLIGYTQDYLDPEVYLVDSLDYEKITPENQQILNYYIQYYHDTDDEVYKISVLYEIVRNCLDFNVWSKYYKVVGKMADEKLNQNLSDSLRSIYGMFKAGTVYYAGWDHYTRTEFDLAVTSFEKSRDLYLEFGDSSGAASAIDNVGSVYSTKGEMAKALEYHLQGLKIRERLRDTLGLGASYNAMGIIHMMHGDYNRAISDFEQAIAFHTHVQWWSGLSNEYSNLGTLESKLGHHEKALEYHLESYRIKEILNEKYGMAISLTNIASISLMNGDTATAIEYQNYALLLSQELNDQRGIAGAMNQLGYIHLLKDEYDEGFEKIEQALKIGSEIGSQMDIRNSLVFMFKGYLWKGEYEKAEQYLQELVNIRKQDIKTNFAVLSEQDKSLYFKTMAEEYDNLYAYGYLTYEINPAITTTLYDNTLMLKGLLLKSSTAMRETILASGDEVLIKQYDQWISLKVEIADAYAKGLNSENLEQSANEIESELVKKSAEFDKFYVGKESTWEDIKLGLSKTETAVEFIRYPKDLLNPDSEVIYGALLIKSNSEQPQLINLCTEKDLEKVLGKVNSNNVLHVNEVYGTRSESKNELSKLIWEPLKKHLSGTEKLYFSPVGLLHKIAFAAINTGDKLLRDQFELVQLNSTEEVLNKKSDNFTSNSQATLFGGVKYHTDSSEHVIWTYLPGTLEEVDSIQSIIANNMKVNFYSGLEASEGHFKELANQSNILHIASHGFFYPDPELVRQETQKDVDMEELEFRGGATNYGIWNFVNNENPLMRSGIALAAANDAWQRDVFAKGEDGVLSAQEVSNLNMTKTELVVLSACETGLGDIQGSEGVYGLQRAFKMAGVKYLIMSLWQVPDKETAEFMTLFYTQLIETQDIRIAFNSAQEQMRKKYDPYYWAAFVLIR